MINTTQSSFLKRSFKKDKNIEFMDKTIQITPQWLLDLGEVQVCMEC